MSKKETTDPFRLGEILFHLQGAADFTLGCGTSARAVSGSVNPFLEFKFAVPERSEDTLVVQLTIRSRCDRPLRIETLLPGLIDAKKGGRLELGDGVSGWTMLSGGLGSGVLDLCDPCFEQQMLDYRAQNYALLGNRAAKRYILFGFLGFLRQGSVIRLHAEAPGFRFAALEACCETAGRLLAPGETLSSEPLCILIGDDPARLVRDYTGRLAAGHRLGDRFRNVIGWATWDCFQRAVTERDVLENVDFLARHRRSLPVEYIQLDDGFAARDGDWLETNGKFPHGLKYLAERIMAAGFKPGLWLCPFLAAPESRVVRAHPDWVLRDASGAPVPLAGYQNPMVYGLDASLPQVRNYLHDLAAEITGEYHFAYLKLDGANAQVLSELGAPAAPEFTRGEAFAAGLKAFRSGMKEGAFLLNACAAGISVGLVDAMRVGADAGARWDGSRIAKHHGERDRFSGPGEVLRAIAAISNHFYTHRKLWINDPDYLVVRQEGCNSELSYCEARSWATVVAMSNGLVMLSDPMAQLLPERLELLEKVLPHAPHPAVPVDFFRKNVPSILAMTAENRSGSWLVAAVINTDKPERPRDYELDFAELGLAPDADYLVFEFWSSRFCGTARGRFTVEALAPRDCRVYALRRKHAGIQLLGTDSHIAMGALEVERFENGVLTVRNCRCRDWRAFFYVPALSGKPRRIIFL